MISKKIIKRSLAGLGSALTLTLGIAFAVNAMDNKEEKVESNKFAFEEWHYDGTPSDSPSDNTKYSPYDGDLCGTENETVCKLFAPAIPGSSPKRPDMTATVTLPGQPAQTIAQRIDDAVGGTTKHINETVLSLRPE